MTQPLGGEHQALGIGVAEAGLAPQPHRQRRLVGPLGERAEPGVELTDRRADPGTQPVGQADRLDDGPPVDRDLGLGDGIRQLVEHTY